MSSPFIVAMLAIAVACAGPTDGITPLTPSELGTIAGNVAPYIR